MKHGESEGNENIRYYASELVCIFLFALMLPSKSVFKCVPAQCFSAQVKFPHRPSV